MPDSAALDHRPSDEDRSRAIEILRTAAPRLGMAELDRRLDAALTAPTVGELATLVWDLQELPAPPTPVKRSIWRSTTFRIHAAAYGLTNTLLVGTWAITATGHTAFWPFFPIAGWGIGLGVHAVATDAAYRHRVERGRRQALMIGEKALNSPRGELNSGSPTDRSGHGQRREAHRAPTAPFRSAVAVMFSDIVDSTRLTAVIGDEDWLRVRGRCRDLLRECYSSHDGAEVSSQGDGFLARFPTPAGAVRCAVEVQRRLQDQRHEIGFAPTLRIGLNCGDAMDEAGDLLGTVVNMAARVMSDAQPGEILTTEAVADRLDDRFALEDRGLRTLKGMARPCHLLSVKWSD